MDRRHDHRYLTSVVKCLKLYELEGHFDSCSNNNCNIINLSCYILLEKKIHLINEGLSFVHTVILTTRQSVIQLWAGQQLS